MKGSITPAGPGKWRLWISAGNDSDGKRLRFSKRFEGSRRAAETDLRKWLNELDRGEVVRATKTTLSSFFETDWGPAQKSRLRPSTLEVNESYFNRYLRRVFGHIALSELSTDPLRDHLSDLLERGGRSGRPLAPSTVLKTQTLLNQLLDAAVDRGLIGRNPAKRIPKPRPQRFEIKVLQPWQVSDLLDYMRVKHPWAEPPTSLAFYAGVRRGELLGLKWDDIDLVSKTLSVRRTYHRLDDGTSSVTPPKTRRSNRAVALTESTVHLLQRLHHEASERMRALGKVISGEQYVFEWIDGEPIRPDSLSQAFRKSAVALGHRGLRFQDTRHTHASLMLKASVHPKIVSERLGHSSIAFTLDTYSHVLPGLQEAAAASFESVMGERFSLPTGSDTVFDPELK